MSDCDYQKCPNCNHDEHNLLGGVECSRSDCSCLASMQEAWDALQKKLAELKDAMDFAGVVLNGFFAKGEN